MAADILSLLQPTASNDRRFDQGQRIHDIDEIGSAWRVTAGAVRFDAPDGEGGLTFAGLAAVGDIVGAETLLFGRCAFRAIALTPCSLTPWPGAVAAEEPSPLQALACAERRAARVVALRAGQAADRVTRLIRLLAPVGGGAGGLAVMPTLRDMADITALTVETVSRALSALRRKGVFAPQGERRGGGSKTCRIAFDPAPT
jgi:CRP/FNR family nitrogen fixation transcriptional regulator